MPGGIFNSHDQGLRDLLAQEFDLLTDTIVAVLVDTAHTPNRATDTTYAAISANECDDAGYAPQVLVSKTVTVAGERTRFTHGEVVFVAEGSIAGRYAYYVHRAGASLASGDKILGHIDLNPSGAGNLASSNDKFAFTANANGLFELPRSVAA